LLARGDRPKVVDLTGREWGPETAGFSLSARQVAQEDSNELPTVSVVLRNNGSAPLTFTASGGWLAFYHFQVVGPDGAEVQLSSYGGQLLKANDGSDKAEVSLAPGTVVETLLPVGTLYSMRARGDYNVKVSCRLPEGAALTSNEATIRP
jgi:hypothetical protein